MLLSIPIGTVTDNTRETLFPEGRGDDATYYSTYPGFFGE